MGLLSFLLDIVHPNLRIYNEKFVHLNILHKQYYSTNSLGYLHKIASGH